MFSVVQLSMGACRPHSSLVCAWVDQQPVIVCWSGLGSLRELRACDSEFAQVKQEATRQLSAQDRVCS